MREQSKDIDYEAGDYVDCHTNDWYPRIIVSKIFNSTTNEFSLKVRDPQYKNSPVQTYSVKSPKISSYRTHSQIRLSFSNLPMVYGKKFESPSVQNRLLALDQFLSSYNSWTPKNIIHFLRGRHFYFNNQLLNSQLQEKSHYQITMNYFKANRRLLAEYIKMVDFDLANPDDIYADRMSAICSAYPEILEISNYAIGVHREMEAFKKQYSSWFVAAEFEAELERWVDQELFPAILEAKHETFNPGFTLGLMCIIGDLLTKVLSKKIKKAPPIMQMLYEQLKASIEIKDFPSKYLYTFQNQCISYFKMFRTGRQQQFDDQSQTQQLDQVNLYDFKAIQADRKHRQLLTNEKQQLANKYKADLRMRICKIYLRKNQIESFSKAFNNILKELIPKTSQTNQQLPSHVQLILQFIKQNNLLEPLLSEKNPTEANSVRVSIIKLFGYCPEYVLNTLIEKQRLALLKHLLHPTNKAIISYGFICGILDKIMAKSKKSTSHKDFIEFFSYMQKMLKQAYQTEENIFQIREKLIYSAFSSAAKMKHNENKLTAESLLQFNDPLRQKCWIEFTQNYVLSNSSSNYCYFYEISLQKYVQKQSVDIKKFANLCSFMTDQTIVEDKYQRRKAIVVQALNFQYKNNRENYLEYLEYFLDAFLDNAHQRQNHDWVSLMVYPTDQKLPSFLDLPMTKQFCKKYLDRMSRVYYELDIHLFCKLMLKLNILTDSINYNSDNDQIAKVTTLPDYFTNLITNLYNNLTIPRFKTIQRQLQRYFHAPEITQILYNKLLTIMLEEMIIKEFKKNQVNIIFRKLKTRQFMINILSTNRPDQTIYCENLNAQQKFLRWDETFKRYPSLFALAQQEQKRALDVAFNRADCLKVLRHRLAFQLNREPTDIILIHQNSRLAEQDYRLSFQEVYFDQCHNITKNTENTKPFIQFRFSDHPPPLRNRIIEKMPILFRYLPSTNSILKGVDLLDHDWNRHQPLHLLKTMFESSLKKGDYHEDMYDCNEKLDILLNYAIWKTNPKDGYITYPLLSYLKSIDSIQTTRRSFKILFLVNRSQYGYLKTPQCQEIISCMMPQNTNSKDKAEKISNIIASDRLYKHIVQIASNLISTFSQKPLEFMSTFCYFSEVQRSEQFLNIYEQMWHEIFVKTDIREKKAFFQTFEEKCLKYPQNMQEFHRLIGKGELEAHQSLYSDVLKTLITILLKYRRRNISLKQLKISQILILTIEIIIRSEDITHPRLYQKQFVDLLFAYIYLYGEQTQTPILNIMRIIMVQENCRKSIINFFIKEIKQKEWSSRPYLIRPANKTIQLPGRVGLRNPHSICYANCFLQQLYHIQIFRDELLHAVYSEKQEPEEDFMYQLKKIFLNLNLGRQAYLNTDFFKAFKSMDGTQTSLQIQMDVDQFRNMLLERIQSSIPSTNNFVKHIFNGKQVSIITSQQCSHISKKQQQFSSLCVDVKGFSSLFHSLQNYFKPQILSGDNSYFCEDCNRKVTAEKTIQIQSYPPYLTFVLKRFEYVSYNRHKINSYFQFPLQNLTYFQGVNYRLKGVIVHIGFSEAGHYVSYAKHNNLWYQFNDCYVHEVSMDIIKENCFGNKGKGNQNNISNLKNAYLLIYQAQKLLYRPTFKEAQTYYGIKDQFKRVSKNVEINKKQRVYFNNFFPYMINQMSMIYKDNNSLYLLFWTLFSIHLKIKSEVNRYQFLVHGLRILKENRYNCKFIWEKQDFGRIKDLLASQMPSEYKSILVQLLIDNCSEYNQSLQALLQVCLKMICYQKAEHSGYYMLMHLAAKKFDDGWRYLNRQRVVGRILDSIFLGIIGEKVREDFKRICQVDYELTFSNASKPFKDNTKSVFKYHKWALIVYIIQRSSNDLHEIQKQNYLFQTTTHIFQSLFMESNDKSSLKYLSKFFALLCKNNQDYSQALIKYLFDQIKQKADPIKYLRVLRDVLDIKDALSIQRNNTSCIFFLRHFSSRYSDKEKKELTFLYMWQWYIYFMSSNLVFRSKVKSTTQLFQQLKSVTINHLNLPRIRHSDGTIRYEVNKQPLYGVSVPTTIKQLEKLLRQCNSRMDFILRDETQQIKIIDFDGDIVEEKPDQNSTIIRFDEKKMKFTKMKVVFAFADLICLQNMSVAATENQNYFTNYCLGDEKLRRITAAVSSFLVAEPPKRKQSSSDNQGQSPRSP